MAAIFVRTLIIYLLVGVLLRLMGKRQIGELEVSELVSTFLISEIAALPIADPDIPLLNGLIPALFILVIEIIVSTAKNKTKKMKRLIEGDPVFLIYKGKLSQSALRDNRLSVNELISAARSSGAGRIEDINYAILEQNGQISVIKKGDEISHPIIIDGEIDEKGLALANVSRERIIAEAQIRGMSIENIFLLTLSEDGAINIIRKERKR